LRASLFGRGTRVRVVGPPEPWLPTVQALPFVGAVAIHGEALAMTLDDPDAQNPALVQALIDAGAQIRYVEPSAHSLEDVYLELLSSALSEE
jgi:ABC-2 type transport system ATP-binding protein